MQGLLQYLRAGKYNDGTGLPLHKHKNSGVQWLYRYTIHGYSREMGLGALTHELANQWRSVLHEGRTHIKERDKQKREAISNLHYLKYIAVDAFESRKAELKNDRKYRNWFAPSWRYIPPKLS
ncbi:hypothetical protein MCY_00641 [Bartonella rattimassiliensis 15908]|uniref:Integrase DNA-binding domain-containing protein n=1 Tax=Bartonella rattimassiliensis 15908 TaxID=1094556 RepID=J0QUF6_9HYPH|nr:hypothetical protein MCY_00641 [Bartonella rattimassiliensis 15908]